MIVRRCSTCGIDYPANQVTFPKCRVCDGKLDACEVTSSNVEDWAYNVELAKAPPADTADTTVRIVTERCKDGVDRMFVPGGDLVRARVCHSADQLVAMAAADLENHPNGLPVVKVLGLTLELQGYDRQRRRWWALPFRPDTDG